MTDAATSGQRVLNGSLRIRNDERFEPATYCEEICGCSINEQNWRPIWLPDKLFVYKLVIAISRAQFENTPETADISGGLTRDSRASLRFSSNVVRCSALAELAIANFAQQIGVLNDEVRTMRMEDTEFGEALEADRDGLPRHARHMREVGMGE